MKFAISSLFFDICNKFPRVNTNSFYGPSEKENCKFGLQFVSLPLFEIWGVCCTKKKIELKIFFGLNFPLNSIKKLLISSHSIRN